MDRQSPRRSAWSRAWLTIPAAALLAACQGLPSQLSLSGEPETAAPGWRVVERLGEARYLAPSMAGWEEVTAGSLIPAGSQIVTGIGGRLIVHHADNQLSAGTSSRFILPGWEAGGGVRQTAGWLRYRIATVPSEAFPIETPFLDLMVDDAVVDVTVGERETEVAVVTGRVQVKTVDGRRQMELHAGYTGYASLQDEPLAVRRGPGARLEAVPPLVLPALHPDRPAAPILVPRPAIAAPPPEAAPITPPPAPAAPAVAAPVAAPPASVHAPASAAAAPAGRAGVPMAQAAAAEVEAVDEIRRRFDALTEGLLDDLPPALPPQRVGR
ncbi:MAG TPA: hypothetical protein VFV80_14590 [Geminicoccaceae bacterium]|nr:hypothetical protein [Geminicoccaceae bacterium]